MPESLERTDTEVETHGLLLSLAGVIDDELLAWCRELAAVGECDYALELVTSAIQADRVRLPGPVHDDLLDAVQRRGVLASTEDFPSPDPAPRMRHRFVGDPLEHGFPPRSEELSPEAALHSVPHRLLRDCQLWLSWRVSPAGGAPGPLPHPVVLIEAIDSAGADVLAYQVGEVLSRAGVFASVEVFGTDVELGDYHRTALAEARTMIGFELPDEDSFPDQGVTGTGPLAPPRATPRPRPDLSATNGVNGTNGHHSATTRRGGAPPDGGARPTGPIGSPGQDGNRRPPPMHPVDRVIAARSSAPRRPRSERQPGSLDDVAAGIDFDRERGRDAGEDSAEHFLGDPGGLGDLGGPADAQEDDTEETTGTEREHPRDAVWGSPREASKTPKPPVAKRDGQLGREHEEPTGPNRATGTGAFGPVDRPERGRPTPPAGPPQPKRVAKRPSADMPESTTELSDVEQRLLRQLHEELAAREDDEDVEPEDEQPPTRIFRGANGGRKRPPRGGPDRDN